MKKKITSPEYMRVISTLRKASNSANVVIWDVVAETLEKSKHRRLAINVSRVNRNSEEGETILVPGKVLGSGSLDHKISIAAVDFSEEAKEKIEKAGGECLTIQTLIQRNSKGSGVKIIG
ncbi:MAG: large subunit ribosomal protein L18e [Thermoproteota archaeon]|nr:large subunit ribosomal protein L18e [Thermoproteota archaeon]